MIPSLKLNHVGGACKNIVKTRDFVCRLHGVKPDAELPKIIDDHRQNIRLCLISVANGFRIELVSGEKVNNLIAKGMSYYHICYSTPDIDSAILELRDLGCIPVFGPIEAVLFGDSRVVFLMTPMGMIELLEEAA